MSKDYKKYKLDPKIYTSKVKEASPDYSILLSDLRDVMKTSQGKNVLWHVLSLCNIYSDVFTGNSQTFHLEGKRAIGLQILKLMEDADPSMYPRLILHQNKR